MNLWYSDLFAPGASLSLQVKRTLFSGQSPYQRIDVLDTTEFGLVLLCDGKVRLTERDAFALHEMLVHPALFTHPAPKRVLVIGGGDGGAIGEVVRHWSSFPPAPAPSAAAIPASGCMSMTASTSSAITGTPLT